jgi:hypothetical protein
VGIVVGVVCLRGFWLLHRQVDLAEAREREREREKKAEFSIWVRLANILARKRLKPDT